MRSGVVESKGVNWVTGSGLRLIRSVLSSFEKIKINPQPDPINYRVYRVIGLLVKKK